MHIAIVVASGDNNLVAGVDLVMSIAWKAKMEASSIAVALNRAQVLSIGTAKDISVGGCIAKLEVGASLVLLTLNLISISTEVGREITWRNILIREEMELW